MSKATQPKKIFRRSTRGVTTFIVTAAQNATGLNIPFIRSLEQLANHRSAAEIFVVPYRYKNPTSRWNTENEHDEWWSDEATPYLCNERKRLNANLMLMGDIPIQATSKNPLNSKHSMSHGESAIYGHPRVQLRSIATLSDYPRIMTTTGSCTLRNYTDTDAGKSGFFHHTTGAVIVEVRGKIFHMRQINATKDGSFVDKHWLYTPRGRQRAPRPLSLTCGDVHCGATDPQIDAAIFGPGGLVKRFKPKYIFLHDLLDGASVNPHTKDNFLALLQSILSGTGDVRGEVERTAAWLDERIPKGSVGVVVPSNHNDWLTRWVKETDPRRSPPNTRFWGETFNKMEDKIKQGVPAERLEAFNYWLAELLPKDGRFKILARDESFVLKGVENGMHGDAGINGGKGSLKAMSTLDLKVTFGHTHVEGIEGGAFNTGAMLSKKQPYTKGASSWTNACALQYFNGKRTLIRFINGEYET